MSVCHKAEYHSIFVSHYGDLCNYASLFVPRQDAEDVVCDIFTNLIETKDPSDVSRNYLFTSVKNRCLNRIRNRQSTKAYQDYIAERLSEYFETPDESLFMDVKEQLCKAIHSKPFFRTFQQGDSPAARTFPQDSRVLHNIFP